MAIISKAIFSGQQNGRRSDRRLSLSTLWVKKYKKSQSNTHELYFGT
jgi:hypothetical protein